MKRILKQDADGVIWTVSPALGSRIAKSVIVDGQTVTGPAPLFELVARVRGIAPLHEADIEGLSPEWAETEAEWLARIAISAAPIDGMVLGALDISDEQMTDPLRPAWKVENGGIGFDMEKARDIWRGRLRAARAPLLADLDIAYQRADETGDADSKANIASRKQALRDITSDPAIDTASTVEELRAFWPFG